jgi:hypothetical protein
VDAGGAGQPHRLTCGFNELVTFATPRPHWVEPVRDGSPARVAVYGWFLRAELPVWPSVWALLQGALGPRGQQPVLVVRCPLHEVEDMSSTLRRWGVCQLLLDEAASCDAKLGRLLLAQVLRLHLVRDADMATTASAEVLFFAHLPARATRAAQTRAAQAPWARFGDHCLPLLAWALAHPLIQAAPPSPALALLSLAVQQGIHAG